MLTIHKRAKAVGQRTFGLVFPASQQSYAGHTLLLLLRRSKYSLQVITPRKPAPAEWIPPKASGNLFPALRGAGGKKKALFAPKSKNGLDREFISGVISFLEFWAAVEDLWTLSLSIYCPSWYCLSRLKKHALKVGLSE
jgi:hypothetical protein